jgi:hypothetical protein
MQLTARYRFSVGVILFTFHNTDINRDHMCFKNMLSHIISDGVIVASVSKAWADTKLILFKIWN